MQFWRSGTTFWWTYSQVTIHHNQFFKETTGAASSWAAVSLAVIVEVE